MFRITFLVLAISVLLSTAIARAEVQGASGDSVQLLNGQTSWTNQSGSIAHLTFVPSTSQTSTYIVSGNYVNNAANTGCQGTPYPVSGLYNTDSGTISFSVSWSNATANCKSITGWTGYIDFTSSSVTITTNWNLAFLAYSGGTIQQGQDVFTMTSASQVQSFLSEK